MKQKRTVVWFRRDLRLQDNLALLAGIEQGSVIPVFIWSPEEEENGKLGEASSWWLHHSLIELDQALKRRGSNLIIRKGRSLPILREIIKETGADALFFNERYEPSIRKRDNYIKQVLEEEKMEVETFHSNVLFPPLSILNKQGQPYKVFTPFWKACLKMPVSFPKSFPTKLPSLPINCPTLLVKELELLPNHSWYKKLSKHWKPGEAGAIHLWNNFMEEKLDEYQSKRDYPSAPHVSRLSPHLAWGEISPKWIWHQLIEMEATNNDFRQDDALAFLRQLGWREFGYHQVVVFPHMVNSPLRNEFLSFPWEEGQRELIAWKQGKTGFPFIDAGMRELWETGWMHNRVRMVTASFLVKHLLLTWKEGAYWFEDTLVDADVANNTMGWQWVTGCGFDSSPYFRIFNPITQGQKFDGNGDYIRQWLPELANLPNQYLHCPWTAPIEILRKSGVELGVSYPLPIIEHSFARERALEAYDRIKK